MKTFISLFAIILCSPLGNVFGQVSGFTNNRYFHAIGYEFWGTGAAYNFQYLFQKKLTNSNAFVQTDAIIGYRHNLLGKNSIIHAYNFSFAFNGGFSHQSGRSVLFGCGLGYDRGLRVARGSVPPFDGTNKSVVTYLRINYSRRLINERLILGFSLVYGLKLIELASSTDPYFNEKIDEFQNWFAPAVSIGYCFGKKDFQKEKSGTD